LKTIEGHLRGITRMVEEDAYCIDVIRQIQAVEAALNKVSSQILEGHLNSCVTTAIQGNNKAERERVLKEHRSVRDVHKSLVVESKHEQNFTVISLLVFRLPVVGHPSP
jgi:DNA-binding FrmR family transcriptional regulator